MEINAIFNYSQNIQDLKKAFCIWVDQMINFRKH